MKYNSNNEVIIVGQGLAGTVLAWQLIKKEIPFKIIAPKGGNNSSTVAAGMINPLVFKRLTQSWMVDELLPEATAFYSYCEQKVGKTFYHPLSIVKPLSENETGLWKKKQNTTAIQPYISSISLQSPIEGLRHFFAYGILKESAYLDTHAFLVASHHYFETHGYLIEEEVNIANITPNNAGIRYGALKAKKLVFCDGFKAIDNPYYPPHCFKLCKGELMLIKSTALPQDYIINRGVFVLPIGDHLFKVGSTYEWDRLDEHTSDDARITLSERLKQLIDVPFEVVQQFAGIRPTVIDRRPLIGFSSHFSCIAFFNGLGTKGVMIAPYFAKQLSMLLNNETQYIHEEANISRFFSSKD